MLAAALGPEVTLAVEGRALVLRLDPALLDPGRRAGWEARLRDLAARAENEAKRRERYGLHALRSYRSNDPSRPTVCLVHGVNSSSGGFVHMIPWLEEAGYGVVVYDYPFNRALGASVEQFTRDWKAFRRASGDTKPWAVVAHSMGALVARGYVEGPEYGSDVASMILIAPVNQGSLLARTQTIKQLLETYQAAGGAGGRRSSADALGHLGDGLGEAAADMTPGSAFLKALNARPRRAGVPYHTLAGDVGVLPRPVRNQFEAQVAAARNRGGLLGGMTRLATGGELAERLDEISDGTGDGCVAVARTRLDGVTDHVTIHANHAELIRAPLLFPDPGPVACMPDLLRWLKADLPPAPANP
jgi:pimeloyl-ACP methyl ester carboxylesterase